MRHTRNRQIVKASKRADWGDTKNYPIQTMRKKMLRQLIDQTFKWHRDFVWEHTKYIESYITIGTYGKPDFKVIWIHPKRVTGWHNSHIQGRYML